VDSLAVDGLVVHRVCRCDWADLPRLGLGYDCLGAACSRQETVRALAAARLDPSTMSCNSSIHLAGPGFLQVHGIEAFGKPVVDLGRH
jgi:hypothetical protein